MPISSETLEKLKANNEQITELNLEVSHLSLKDLDLLAQALEKNDQLQSLDLSGNYLTAEAALPISRILKTNRSLKTLSLLSNNIGDKGIEILADSLIHNTSLTDLKLVNNNIGEVGAQVIAGILEHNQTLKKLYLAGNQVKKKGGIALAKVLTKSNSLTILDLSGGKIGNDATEDLALALIHNKSLTNLSLWDNEISEKGAIALGEALYRNHSLNSLIFRGNKLGKKGAQAFASALKKAHCSLHTLYFDYINPTDEELTIFAKSLATNRSLHTLILSNNSIGITGAKALFTALGSNTTLTTLDLSQNPIKATETETKAMIDLLKKNQSLIELDIKGNPTSTASFQSAVESQVRWNRAFAHTVLNQLNDNYIIENHEFLSRYVNVLHHHLKNKDIISRYSMVDYCSMQEKIAEITIPFSLQERNLLTVIYPSMPSEQQSFLARQLVTNKAFYTEFSTLIEQYNNGALKLHASVAKILQKLATDAEIFSSEEKTPPLTPEEHHYLRKVMNVISHINEIASGIDRTLEVQAKTLDALLLTSPSTPEKASSPKMSVQDRLDLRSINTEEKTIVPKPQPFITRLQNAKVKRFTDQEEENLLLSLEKKETSPGRGR